VRVTPTAIWVARIGLGFVAILMLCIVGLMLTPWYFSRPMKVPVAAPTVVAELNGAPFLSPEPVIRSAAHKDLPRQALVGPMFASQDSKYEMTLRDFPFTFITPRSWGCLAASVGVDAKAWRCIDESAGPNRPQLDIVFRHCPGPCTEAHRAEVNRTMKQPPTYVDASDAATRFVERTIDGRYVLTLDRVFGGSAGKPADSLLVIQATSRPTEAATVQKIVNDVYSQTL
jgi:hypothetical protein